MSDPRFLIIETSHRRGLVALAYGNRVVGQRVLEEARRHCRELVPSVKELLDEHGWNMNNLTGVIASRGPGSYTGLRVGLMSAKTLAYATGRALLAVDTFAAIALQGPPQAATVDVIADAQQEKAYVQRFHRESNAWVAAAPLAIRPFLEWRETLSPSNWVSGPGLEIFAARLPAEIQRVAPGNWTPKSESLLKLGLERWRRGDVDDVFTVEPLYLRVSAAEEKWAAKP